MARASMPPHQILDRDIEVFKGTLYSCQEEYEMGTVPHFKTKEQARRDARDADIVCEQVFEESGFWVRVNHDDYDRAWHGPFSTSDEAVSFVDRVWNPVKTGFRMDADLEGLRQTPAWIRRG